MGWNNVSRTWLFFIFIFSFFFFCFRFAVASLNLTLYKTTVGGGGGGLGGRYENVVLGLCLVLQPEILQFLPPPLIEKEIYAKVIDRKNIFL